MNDEAREAARYLLRNPLVPAALEPEEHRRIRRHGDDLTAMFRTYLGYRLVVDARLARLYKAGLGDDPARALVVRASRAAFSPRDYTYLSLTCSVLLSSGQQILLSSLVEDVEQAAAEAGIELSQGTRTERLALVHALRQLVSWGALVEEDGAVGGYAEQETTQVLFTIERDVVRELLSTPLRDVPDPPGLIRKAVEVAPEALRHRVRRLVVECPVVMLDDLTEAERLWLRQSQRREAGLLEENFGLSLEIRAEGVAAFDPCDELSDLFFPRDGTAAQAALLTLAALVEDANGEVAAGSGTAGSSSRQTSPPAEVPVLPAALEEVAESLLDKHAKSWAKLFLDRPDRLAREVEELLVSMGLLVRTDGELRMRAIAARYAPEPVEHPETRPQEAISQTFALEAP